MESNHSADPDHLLWSDYDLVCLECGLKVRTKQGGLERVLRVQDRSLQKGWVIDNLTHKCYWRPPPYSSLDRPKHAWAYSSGFFSSSAVPLIFSTGLLLFMMSSVSSCRFCNLNMQHRTNKTETPCQTNQLSVHREMSCWSISGRAWGEADVKQ